LGELIKDGKDWMGLSESLTLIARAGVTELEDGM